MTYPYGVGLPPTPMAPPVGAPSMMPLPPQGYYPPAPPQQQPPMQVPTPPTQGTGSVSGDMILDGPGIPPELRGRKMSDVIRVYNALADDFVTRKRQNNGQPPQQQSPTQQPPQQQRPPQQSLWQSDDPDARIAEIVRSVVSEAVQPFQQQTLAQNTQTAMERARQVIPDFVELEADILETVKGSSQEALANIDYWINAADLARGRRFRAQSQQQPPVSQPQFSGQHPLSSVPAPTQYPQPQQPQPQPSFPQPQPQRPATHSFFTEAPTAPSPYASTHAAALTPAQQEVARMAGVSHEQYAAMAALQRRGR